MKHRWMIVLLTALLFVTSNVSAQEYKAGDANGDGKVNVTDIVEIVNYILGSPSDHFIFEAADVNDDGVVNVTDIVSVVSVILSPEDDTEDVPVLNVYLQQGDKVGKETYPRFTAFIGKQMLAQFSDPSHPEIMMLNYVDEDSHHDVTLLVTTHNILIMNHNPYLNSSFPETALVVGDYDNYSSIAVGNVNWDLHVIEIVPNSTVAFDGPVYSPSAAARRGASEEYFIGMFMDFVENLGKELGQKKEKVDEIGKVTSQLGLGNLMEGASKLLSRYGSLVTPSMKYILSSDSEILNQNEILSEVVSDNLQNALTDDILDAVKSYMIRAIPVSENDVNGCLWVAKMTQKSMTSDEVDQKVEEPDELVGDFINQSTERMSAVSKSMGMALPTVNQTISKAASDEGVKLTVTVGGVTETSIQVSGTVSITESTYLSYQEVEFVLTGGGKAITIPTRLNGSTLEPVTFTGLDQGTAYTIHAVYVPMLSEKTFYSDPVTVTTKGEVSTDWAGTAWNLVGTVTAEGETDPVTMLLDFSRLDENIINFSIDGESLGDIGCTYTVDSSGNLELKFSLTVYGSDGQSAKEDFTFKFIRTGAATATATMNDTAYIHYPAEWKKYGYSDHTYLATGQFQCTRTK